MANFAFAMKQNYDIKVQTVHDYNEFVGVENTHPYVSVIHYDELSPIRHSHSMAVYGLFLLDNTSEQLVTVQESMITMQEVSCAYLHPK